MSRKAIALIIVCVSLVGVSPLMAADSGWIPASPNDETILEEDGVGFHEVYLEAGTGWFTPDHWETIEVGAVYEIYLLDGCSTLGEGAKERSLAWVELYYDGESLGMVSIPISAFLDQVCN